VLRHKSCSKNAKSLLNLHTFTYPIFEASNLDVLYTVHQNADTMAAAAALQCISPPIVGAVEPELCVYNPRSAPPASWCAATVSLETELWYM
jgi:hypothetical protein